MPKKIFTLPGTFIFWISIFTRERFWQEREREMIMLLIQKSLTADHLAGQELWYWININPMEMYCWSIILPSWDKSLSFPETTPIPRDTLKATTNPFYILFMYQYFQSTVQLSHLYGNHLSHDHFLMNFNFLIVCKIVM